MELPGKIPSWEVSGVSPYYFGPNAFPIPDMLTEVSGDLRIELGGDYFSGHNGSNTYDIYLKANIPLWTKRANLSLWMPVMEWYRNSERSIAGSLVVPDKRDLARKGSMAGDVYVSVDMQLLVEGRCRPGWTLRAALKTASGDGYEICRYYDDPGYFFDTYFSKGLLLDRCTGFKVRGSIGGGFLCWQTANGRQNDAVMYGVQVGFDILNLSVTGTFSGYAGWESNACGNGEEAHDRPMSLKTDMSYRMGNWEITGRFQYGLMDYPFTQFRLGCVWHWDILGVCGLRKNR